MLRSATILAPLPTGTASWVGAFASSSHSASVHINTKATLADLHKLYARFDQRLFFRIASPFRSASTYWAKEFVFVTLAAYGHLLRGRPSAHKSVDTSAQILATLQF